MPIFTAIAAGVAAIASAIGFSAATAATIGAIGAMAARTILTLGISKLLSNTTDTPAGGSNTPAADPRAQKSPTTINKISVVYGSAYLGPTIIDAILSTDQTTMYYVCALSEVTDTGTISFDKIYYNGDLITLGTGGDAAKVLSLTNNAVPVSQTDIKIAGSMWVYLFNNGSSSGINTSGQTAIQILSDGSIPTESRWSSTDTMSNCAFAIVKLIYNQDKNTTQLGQLNFQLYNTLTKPGSVIQDYLTNTVYGCAIPLDNVDTASLTNLNTYSDELIEYVPVGGGIATQARYRINGPINTGQNCLANLQDLCDACDSWLQYSELTGQWKVVINQSYEQAGETFGDLYLVDSSVLIGGIDINPIDLNLTYNSLEVGYPNINIKDQTDYRVFQLIDYVPEVMSPNEAANQLSVNFPQVNNYIQAAYLGERKLLQSREDLIITCNLDYSGIQIEAGDVVRVTLEEYGWVNKLFRVSQVQEVKNEQGFLGARITAFEYNGTIYTDNPLDDFIPEANTGLNNPNWLTTPGTPTIQVDSIANATIASFTVTSATPATGSTMYMDFNYGTTSNVDTHLLYSSVQTSTGKPFINNEDVQVHSVNLPAGTYYWSTTARTTTTGYKSLSSAAYTWGGPNITRYTSTTKTGANSTGTTVYVDTTNVRVGQNVAVESGTGSIADGVKVAAILGLGSLLLSALPISDLVGAVVKFFGGGANTDNINDGAVTADKISNTVTGISTKIGVVLYAMYNGTSTTYMPVDIASTAFDDNVPVYILGTSVSSTEYTPWAQGTSSTANGYYSNSTAPFQPAKASRRKITNGDNAWYSFIYSSYGTVTVPAGAYINDALQMTIVSDADTDIQIASYATFTTTSYLYTGDDLTYTIPLKSNQVFTLSTLAESQGTATSDGTGWMIRNMSSGANVVVMYASSSTSYF